MTTVFHAWPYGRFIEIQNNLKRKKFIEQIKAPIFLEAVLARDNVRAPIHFSNPWIFSYNTYSAKTPSNFFTMFVCNMVKTCDNY